MSPDLSPPLQGLLSCKMTGYLLFFKRLCIGWVFCCWHEDVLTFPPPLSKGKWLQRLALDTFCRPPLSFFRCPAVVEFVLFL